MTAENFMGPLQCLRWAKNREMKALAQAAVKAIYAKLGVRHCLLSQVAVNSLPTLGSG